MRYPSFRSVLAAAAPVRVAGVHSALGGILAEEAGFGAVWASSFEISAAHGLPDASLLTMTDYLTTAAAVQRRVGVPVVADCDTGFGGAMNVAWMVREYERAGITAVCMEDKVFPKMNSFVAAEHALLDVDAFCHKIEVAKRVQASPDFFVIARTEALIAGAGMAEALRRCHAYADAGADAVLILFRAKVRTEIVEFLDLWSGRLPVVIVPTTYPDWHIDEIAAAGVSVVIYANQGLRATVSSLRHTFGHIRDEGRSAQLESRIATVPDIFALQQLSTWQEFED